MARYELLSLSCAELTSSFVAFFVSSVVTATNGIGRRFYVHHYRIIDATITVVSSPTRTHSSRGRAHTRRSVAECRRGSRCGHWCGECGTCTSHSRARCVLRDSGGSRREHDGSVIRHRGRGEHRPKRRGVLWSQYGAGRWTSG